jgi:hypothetical protein
MDVAHGGLNSAVACELLQGSHVLGMAARFREKGMAQGMESGVRMEAMLIRYA